MNSTLKRSSAARTDTRARPAAGGGRAGGIRQRVPAGRELAIEDALASKAHIDALAVTLRRGGLPGTLQQLRVLAFNDLTQGRDPRTGLQAPTQPGRAGRLGARQPGAWPGACGRRTPGTRHALW